MRLPAPRASTAEPFGRAPMSVWKRNVPRWVVLTLAGVFSVFLVLFVIGGMG